MKGNVSVGSGLTVDRNKVHGYELPHSKKSPSKMLELKGSNIKCLRGIEPSIAESLFADVSEEDVSLPELQIYC